MEGVTTVLSRFGPKETMDRFEAEIRGKGMTVFARVNHAELAVEAGMALRPAEAIIFGNPRAGTPLMQASQLMGIDLPLRALVWRDAEGKTWLSYIDPEWLVRRYQAAGADKPAAGISQALGVLAAKATGGSS